MKLIKILFFIFLLTPLQANAELAISSWQESAQLNYDGKSSEIVIRGKVVNLPADRALSSFSIIFDPSQNIKILRVINDNKLADYSKSANYSFINNALTIKFLEGKKNNDTISIYFSYNEKYERINRYLRQEAIYVPSFAAGANATVTFNFPGYFESATFNPNIVKNGNSFVYSNIVPRDGVQEIIKLTPAQSTWNITMKSSIRTNKPLGKLAVKVPVFFQSARQKTQDYNLIASVSPKTQNRESGINSLTFDTSAQEILISSNAKITTGSNSRGTFLRNAANYIRVSSEETNLLSKMLEKIKSDPSYGNIPLYAKIGKFTHDFLRYDIRYLGKLPSLQEILQSRSGVCTEYAHLFDALARLGGIPSIIIDGGACGEYDECQGHSWNMIYQGGQWIEVDPTWNLMSGIVSSSHVYINEHGQGETGVEYYDSGKDIKIKMDLEMKNLE